MPRAPLRPERNEEPTSDGAVGAQEKDDPVDVARDGLNAMMAGNGDVVSGWKNKIQSALANVTPAGRVAEQHPSHGRTPH